jgi:hypothetical protein
MLVRNILYKRLAECPDHEPTSATPNSLDDSDEWEELPVLLQSGDVSDLIWAARQRGLSASILAGSILREFLEEKRRGDVRRWPAPAPSKIQACPSH